MLNIESILEKMGKEDAWEVSIPKYLVSLKGITDFFTAKQLTDHFAELKKQGATTKSISRDFQLKQALFAQAGRSPKEAVDKMAAEIRKDPRLYSVLFDDFIPAKNFDLGASSTDHTFVVNLLDLPDLLDYKTKDFAKVLTLYDVYKVMQAVFEAEQKLEVYSRDLLRILGFEEPGGSKQKHHVPSGLNKSSASKAPPFDKSSEIKMHEKSINFVVDEEKQTWSETELNQRSTTLSRSQPSSRQAARIRGPRSQALPRPRGRPAGPSTRLP